MTTQKQIMIVDDETALLKIIQLFLHQSGFQTVPFASAEAAVSRFQQTPDAFQLVITDMSMPGMDGITLARTLRQINPGIPIILCTGDRADAVAELENESEPIIDVCVEKPLLLQDLLDTLHSVLNGR